MNIFKILRPFLKPTSEGKVPTDVNLDHDIAYVSDILHKLSPMMKHIIWRKIVLFFLYRWKYLFGRLVVIGLITTLVILLLTTFTPVKIITHDPPVRVVIKSYPADSTMNLRNFLAQMAYCESRYQIDAHRDSSQYLGLYQLGKNARDLGGYGDIPRNIFLTHPEIQDLCMINLLKQEKQYLQSYINKYRGKIVDGILITESGILAMAHVGTEATKSYLDHGEIPDVDEHGNHPRVYAKLGGYQLHLEKVKYSVEDSN